METEGTRKDFAISWRLALLLGLTVFVLFLTVYCLSYGIQNVFPHIYYVPIILAAFWYRMKGVIFSAVLGFLYLSCVISFTGYNMVNIVSAATRVIVFVIIAAIVMVLSKRITDLNATVDQSEHKFRNIWDHIQAGIILVDAKTRKILAVNPEAERLTGYTEAELIGKSCHKVICPAEMGRCPVTDLGHTVDRSERILLARGGEQIPVLKTVKPAMIDGKKVLIENFIRLQDSGGDQE